MCPPYEAGPQHHGFTIHDYDASPAGSLVMMGVPEDGICAPEADDPAFGTELAPAALRAAGLTEATGAVDSGDLPVRLVGRVRDVGTGVLGWPSVLQLTYRQTV